MFSPPGDGTDEAGQELPSHVTAVDLPHGIAVGDVTRDSAVVWARTDGPAYVHVEYATSPTFRDSRHIDPVRTVPDSDYTVKIRLSGLEPGETYHYRVWALRGHADSWLVEPPATAMAGEFVTPPTADTDAPVSFVWSGDTYGQGREPPYRVFAEMEGVDPDFFHYQGDTIYADAETPAIPDGEPENVDDYRAKYKEMREQGVNLRSLLQSTSVVTIWDDHEVYNDWSGTQSDLMPAGREAFLEYWPVDENPAVTGDDDTRLYRKFRWGSDVELFVLDTRQYRDANEKEDGPGKTMLGDEQKTWLKESLAETDATFAVVSSSTSLASVSSPPHARDSWASGDSATGFEHELQEIVEFVQDEVDSTVVWLSGDRHFARVMSYDLDEDGTPEMYEALATPIGASPRNPASYTPDPTFSPTVHYEEGGKYELGEFYNFGHVQVDGSTLTIDIVDKVGDRRCRTVIDADDDADPLTVETEELGDEDPDIDPDPLGFLRSLLGGD